MSKTITIQAGDFWSMVGPVLDALREREDAAFDWDRRMVRSFFGDETDKFAEPALPRPDPFRRIVIGHDAFMAIAKSNDAHYGSIVMFDPLCGCLFFEDIKAERSGEVGLMDIVLS